ncbi:MAG: hypothetical protein OXF23_03650 [Candidatus Dadabacteria bacterium]|nr:hypothetical protein [Candidatus Dadabacteria bacterium]
MPSTDAEQYRKQLQKLRGKAELSRYCHSELGQRFTMWRNAKEFLILVLSLFLTVMVNFYYRQLVSGDWALMTISLLPILVALLQGLDHFVCHWSNRSVRHESSVIVWGHWVREADSLEKKIDGFNGRVAREKMEEIEEKYRNCMQNSAQVPNKKFLQYKRSFRHYVLKSKAIGDMTLEELERWQERCKTHKIKP